MADCDKPWLMEERKDVFAYEGRVYLAHCIATDLRMGAGIAVEFQKRFHLRGAIQSSGESLKHPTCVFVNGVFNLITKARSSGKPTLRSLRIAVRKMAEIAKSRGIEQIAMPRIGCGLDRLSWAEVREVIKEEMWPHGVSAMVCRL